MGEELGGEMTFDTIIGRSLANDSKNSGVQMKKTLSLFSKLLHKKKDNKLKIETPNIQKGIEKTVRISDEFEINVKGLPNNLTEEEQKKVFISLLKNGLNLSKDKAYQKGDSVFRGKAILNIKDKVYQIEYSIGAMKVLQALAVYKEAFDYVNQGAESGQFDPELAEVAADFFKESARQEVFGYSSAKRKTTIEVKPAEINELPANQNSNQEERRHGT